MIKRTVFKCIGMIAATAAMCGAELYGMRPCGAGFCAALLYCGAPALVAFPAYILFSLLFDFSLRSLAYAASVVIATTVAAAVGMKVPRAKKPLYAAFLALSQVSLAFYYSSMGLLPLVVWGTFALGIFAAGVCFLRPVLVRKLEYKFLETELVCGGVLLICTALGLTKAEVYGFDAAYLIAGFLIPFSVAAGSVGGAVAVGMCFGTGIALSSMQAEPIAFMAFAALVSAIFTAAPRPIASLSTALAYLLASYLFSAPPSWQQLLCFTVGALAFSLIPSRVAAKVREALFAPVTALAARSIVNRAAFETGRDLIGASQIFADMKIAMERVPPAREGADYLEKKVCAHCDSHGDCLAYPGYKEALAGMERASAQKGRASVAEMPRLLSDCSRLGELINCASTSAQVMHEQMLTAEAKSEGRKVVATQLGLMSRVLGEMGERVRKPAVFDTAKEKKIAEELTYRGAAVPEVIVTENRISVVIRFDEFPRENIAEAVSAAAGGRYELVETTADVLPGYTLMLFERRPRLDVAFAAAGIAKDGDKSGDNHSFVTLGGNRFMTTLCDGMGSGEEAREASATAIELVESFFRAGLDSMNAVECVNRFLALNECERFSTLDITVIDLESGVAEIIKLSSPATVIRSRDGVASVSGAALPMGVLEEVRCTHASRKLAPGDRVIMTSDGVSDVLGEDVMLSLASRVPDDPTAAAREVLDTAVRVQGGAVRDDCTVLCVGLYERRSNS